MKRPNIVGLTEHRNKTVILQALSQDKKFIKKHFLENKTGAGVTFDWLFFDNSKLIDFDDKNVSFLRKHFFIIEREKEKEPNLT
jgi:hypothetical protein